MNTHPISFRSLVRSGWSIFKKHWKLLILAEIATFIINIILRLIQNRAEWRLQTGDIFMPLIAIIFVVLVSIVIQLGWTKVFLKLVRMDQIGWDDFKTTPMVWARMIKATLWYLGYIIGYLAIFAIPILLIGGIVSLAHASEAAFIIQGPILGIVLCCVLVYVSIRYMFVTYVVLDSPEMSSHHVVKRAGTLTKKSFWKLLGIMILLGLFNLVGAICLVVGLFVTIPVSRLAKTKIYETLREQQG